MQFNQVVLLEFNTYPSPIYTVPAGKIWKVESAGQGCGMRIETINGNDTGGMDIGENLYEVKLPMWLPENTTINFGNGCAPDWAYVSILEFTVIP